MTTWLGGVGSERIVAGTVDAGQTTSGLRSDACDGNGNDRDISCGAAERIACRSLLVCAMIRRINWSQQKEMDASVRLIEKERAWRKIKIINCITRTCSTLPFFNPNLNLVRTLRCTDGKPTAVEIACCSERSRSEAQTSRAPLSGRGQHANTR